MGGVSAVATSAGTHRTRTGGSPPVWNFRPCPADTLRVTGTPAACQQCRDSLSAGWDGEPGELTDAETAAHLTGCAACRDWQERTSAVSRLLKVRSADDVPDLSAAIGAAAAANGLVRPMPATGAGSRRGPAWWWSTDTWRVALTVIAVAQLLLGVAQLFGISLFGVAGHADHLMMAGPPDDHLFNESSAWNIAIGAGFAAAAMMPRRASGLLPMLLVFLGVLTAVSVADLVRGEVTAARVVSHLLVVLGVLVLWRVDRSYRRAPLPGQRQAGWDAVPPVGDRSTGAVDRPVDADGTGRRGRWLRPAGRRAA